MSHAQQSNPHERSPEWLQAEAEAIARQKRMSAATDSGKKGASPRLVEKFEPAFGKCEQHGDYPINAQDAAGTVRWMAMVCPSCARQASIAKLMNRAAISPRFDHCTFASYRAETAEQKNALETCQAYAADFKAGREAGRCLILRGNPGTGKNHLSTAIARAVMIDGFTVLNATAFEIIRRVRDTWRPDSTETEAQVIKAFADIDLLIIDEVGRQYQAKDGSDSVEIFNVIDQRYRYIRPTVVMSNQTRDGLKKFLGDAAYDRLREGGAVLVNFDWDSGRK